MSVSRDFIDSYSPKPRANADTVLLADLVRRCLSSTATNGASTTLVFGFHVRQDLLKTLITLGQGAGFVLALAQKRLQGAVQGDGLVDLGAAPGPIGPQADQFLHVGVGGHDLARAGEDRQVARVGG